MHVCVCVCVLVCVLMWIFDFVFQAMGWDLRCCSVMETMLVRLLRPKRQDLDHSIYLPASVSFTIDLLSVDTSWLQADD